MEKLTAYRMTAAEAEEKLQDLLDNADLRLVRRQWYYRADSDSQYLDGAEIDERLAQVLGVKACEHFAADDGSLLAVVTEE